MAMLIKCLAIQLTFRKPQFIFGPVLTQRLSLHQLCGEETKAKGSGPSEASDQSHPWVTSSACPSLYGSQRAHTSPDQITAPPLQGRKQGSLVSVGSGL